MKIREQLSISPTSPDYYRAMVMRSIEELEEQLREGKIEWSAYVTKKKSLLRML